MSEQSKRFSTSLNGTAQALIDYTDGLEAENNSLKKELVELKEKKSFNFKVEGCQDVINVLANIKSVLLSFRIAFTYPSIKVLDGLIEYVLTHKVEINDHIDSHPEIFKGDTNEDV